MCRNHENQFAPSIHQIKGPFVLWVLYNGLGIKMKSIVWFVYLGLKIGTHPKNEGICKT
jgi:hypothetical protein